MIKRFIIILVIIIIIIIGIFIFNRNKNNYNKENVQESVEYINYEDFYNKPAVIKNDTNLYKLESGNYIEFGSIYKDTKILIANEYDEKKKYFKIQDLGNKYYIKYEDIEVSDNYYDEEKRYLSYIPFNNNVISNVSVSLYKDEKKLYTLNESINLPIVIKKSDRYYVQFNGMLLNIRKEDVNEIIENNNSDKKNTNGVPVLNYHFVYKPEDEKCNQDICHTEEQFRLHLKYIKDNSFFTPTMNELEMYIDGEIQLPKSVVITIDDGRNVDLATKIIDEYGLQATAFIITGRFNIERDFVRSDNVEFHSHSHNLHNAGSCPPGHGQGGGLTCFKDEDILEDLRKSREILNGAIAFCYPFYEYNNHSIELLKQAGFRMGFAGEYANGKTKVTVGTDKFRLPRWVIVNYTTIDKFKNYVNGYE